MNIPVLFSPLENFSINSWMTHPSQWFWAFESQAGGLADCAAPLCLQQLVDLHLQGLMFP